MQKCKSCGAYFSDFDQVCPHCGWTTEKEHETAEEIKPEASAENPWQTSAARPEETYSRYPQENREVFTESTREAALPMKWHKFLMVVLIIGAVGNIISGFSLLIYPDADTMTMDMILGIACIGLGVFQLYVRNRMAAFRKGSPTLLLILYGGKTVIDVISMLTTGTSFYPVGGDETGTGLYVYLILMVFYLLMNYWYYKKRENMFVN